MPFIQEEVVTDESLAAEAANVAAPEKVKKSRSKLTDEQRAAKQLEKEAKAAKPPKEPKAPKVKVDKFIKVLVPAAESGLRPGTGRFQFLEAAANVTNVSELVGQKFAVGDKEVTLGMNNVQGMYSRGHIALSADGENWDRIQTITVTESDE